MLSKERTSGVSDATLSAVMLSASSPAEDVLLPQDAKARDVRVRKRMKSV